jgi:acetylornithine deacetylase/succinyl-diaminopimelate desuccinylase-like protein
MYTILRNKNDGLKSEMIRFARELVHTPSVSLQESKAADLVEAKMREVGYDQVFRDEAGNVIGMILAREAEPTVLLNCHLDTVAPEPADDGQTSPAAGACLKNGRLYGLGAADCKGGLAAQVFAGALLERSMLPLRGNLIVAATVAEENGRSIGVRRLMEHTFPKLGLKPTYAILGEPTSMGLYYGHDGWLEMDILVKGSDPFQVDDAARAIFDDMGERGSRGDSRAPSPLEMMAIRQPRFENANGVRHATIPVSRRLAPGEDAGHVLNLVRHSAVLVAQPIGAVAVEVAIRQEPQLLYNGQTTMVRHITHAWSIDPFHPLMSRARHSLAAAECEVRPGKWQLGRLGMGTAGSVLVKEFNVPTIGYGPGNETLAHAAGEYVETDKMVEAVYGTAAMVHGLIGIPVCGWTSDEI